MNQLTNLSSAEISAQHEQDAKDLTRILPASKKFILKALALIFRFQCEKFLLTDTPTGLGGEHNPPIMVYDTSGVYTDPNVQIDLNKGLPSVRQNGLKSVTILTFFLA